MRNSGQTMRSQNYYRTRTAVRILFWIGFAAVIYLLATHINWVGDGYCFGSIDKCYPTTIGGK